MHLSGSGCLRIWISSNRPDRGGMHTLHKVRSEPNDISSLKSSTDNTFGSKIARNFDGCHGRNSVLLSEEAQQFIGNMSFCNAQNGTCTECPQMALIRS